MERSTLRYLIDGGIMGGIAASFGIITGVARWLIRTAKQIDQLLEDWNGIQSRPGVRARPGVMERLEKIETALETRKRTEEES